jgi:glycosyltransferase involved in cell wall biosynthesis
VRWCFFSPGHRSLQVLSGDSRLTGGAEAQVAYLALALAGMGQEVGLIYGEGRGQGAQQVVAGVTCIDAAPAWRHLASMHVFWQAMKSLAPDMLYARLPDDFLWMMGLYAKQHSARFVYAIANDLHCDPSTAYTYKQWFHSPLFALGLQSADLISVQHDNQRDLLRPRLRSRLVHIPNLLRAIRETPRDYDETLYDGIWVAKIRAEKRIDLFLDLVAARPNLRFALVGGFDPTISEDTRTHLERQMQSLPNLEVLGARRAEEVAALISQSKLLVNTSQSEGFPNTMLEAWSVGTPVVSLAIDPGGIIERERLGFLSGNFNQLCRHVESLAGSAELNRDLGGRGLAYVRGHHSPEAVCKSLEAVVPGLHHAPLLAHDA